MSERDIVDEYEKLVLRRLAPGLRLLTARPQAPTFSIPKAEFYEEVEKVLTVFEELQAEKRRIATETMSKSRKVYDPLVTPEVLRNHLETWNPSRQEFGALLNHLRDARDEKRRRLEDKRKLSELERLKSVQLALVQPDLPDLPNHPELFPVATARQLIAPQALSNNYRDEPPWQQMSAAWYGESSQVRLKESQLTTTANQNQFLAPKQPPTNWPEQAAVVFRQPAALLLPAVAEYDSGASQQFPAGSLSQQERYLPLVQTASTHTIQAIGGQFNLMMRDATSIETASQPALVQIAGLRQPKVPASPAVFERYSGEGMPSQERARWSAAVSPQEGRCFESTQADFSSQAQAEIQQFFRAHDSAPSMCNHPELSHAFASRTAMPAGAYAQPGTSRNFGDDQLGQLFSPPTKRWHGMDSAEDPTQFALATLDQSGFSSANWNEPETSRTLSHRQFYPIDFYEIQGSTSPTVMVSNLTSNEEIVNMCQQGFNRQHLRHLLNFAISSTMILPAFAAGALTIPQRVVLNNALCIVLRNPESLLGYLEKLAYEKRLQRTDGGLLPYQFCDLFTPAFLCALAWALQQLKIDMEEPVIEVHQIWKSLREGAGDSRLFFFKQLQEFHNWFYSMPHHIPRFEEDIKEIVKHHGKSHHFGQCPGCDHIGFGNTKNPLLRALFIRKHLADMFANQVDYLAMYSLMPLLKRDREGLALALRNEQLNKLLVQTRSGHVFEIFSYGMQTSKDENGDPVQCHTFGVVELELSREFVYTGILEADAGIRSLVNVSPGRPIHPSEVLLAYSGSLRAADEFFWSAFRAGLASDETIFFQLDLQSSSDEQENILTLPRHQEMPFRFVRLARLWIRHKCLRKDPPAKCDHGLLSEDGLSFVALTLRYLGVPALCKRFQLVVEVEPHSHKTQHRFRFDAGVAFEQILNLRLRNVGLITADCLKKLTSLNISGLRGLSHNDLSGVETQLQEVLRLWLNQHTVPELLLSLDYTNLQLDDTVSLLFDLGTSLRWLSLNGNAQLGASLFKRLQHTAIIRSSSATVIRTFATLRRLSINGCLTKVHIDAICYLAKVTNRINKSGAGFAGVTIRTKVADSGRFENAGAMVHFGGVSNVFTEETLLVEL